MPIDIIETENGQKFIRIQMNLPNSINSITKIYKTKKIESKWDNNNDNCVGGCNGCRVF